MLSGSRHKRQETSEDSVSVWGYITKYDYGRKAIPADQRIKEIQIEVRAEDSRSKESHDTIQLWTNQEQNQYAIKLEGKSDLLATTNQNVQYTHLVGESHYLEELEYDWDYTLKHFINNIIENQSRAQIARAQFRATCTSKG